MSRHESDSDKYDELEFDSVMEKRFLAKGRRRFDQPTKKHWADDELDSYDDNDYDYDDVESDQRSGEN